METMKYLELAVSKDSTRFNLQRIYRAETELVATDGHRLHLSNGLEKTTPHYVDGYDGAFPEYTQVMPKQAPSGKFEIAPIYKGQKEVLRKLKELSKLAKWADRSFPVKLILQSGKAPLIAIESKDLKLTYTLSFEAYEGEDIALGLNLSYFIDAISFIDESLSGAIVNIHNESGPILIQGTGLAEKFKAIVMPQRL